MNKLTPLIALVLTSCSTIYRRDLGTKVINGVEHEAVQSTLFGWPVPFMTKWVEKVSTTVHLATILSSPATLVLGITLPLAIVLAALMVVGVSNPLWMKRIGWAAMFMFVASAIAGAWIVVSQWPLLFIPVVGVVLWLAYRRTQGKRLSWKMK